MFKALLFAVPFLVQGVNSTPPSVQVSGRVTADNATGTRVIRVAMSSAAGAEPLTAIVDSDGSFEFSRVLPGTYSAFAFTATSVSAPVTLTVGGANLTNLTIRLPILMSPQTLF